MSLPRSRVWSALAATLFMFHGTGCAGPVRAPAPGTSTLAGHVEVRPLVGTAQAGSGGSSYGDRRLREATRVDYSRPGFAVVYLERVDPREQSAPAEPDALVLELSDSPTRLRIDPSEVAIRQGSRLTIRNHSRSPHVVSIPDLGRVIPLEPAQATTLVIDRPGDLAIHVLDQPGTAARLFSAPGPFAQVSDSGRFVLADLAPGAYVAHVWHSRLPPISTPVVLRPDQIVPIELSLGSPGKNGD